MTDNDLNVQHHPALNRFEIALGDQKAVLEYHRSEAVITFTHTGVPRALEGRGIGSQLVRAGLDYARAQGCRVVPACPFVAAYIHRHPEYQDLLA